MSKMKELYTEKTNIELDVAECANCGNEIEFANNLEFEKLSSEHICSGRWYC